MTVDEKAAFIISQRKAIADIFGTWIVFMTCTRSTREAMAQRFIDQLIDYINEEEAGDRGDI
jgi:hypothetical protein